MPTALGRFLLWRATLRQTLARQHSNLFGRNYRVTNCWRGTLTESNSQATLVPSWEE